MGHIVPNESLAHTKRALFVVSMLAATGVRIQAFAVCVAALAYYSGSSSIQTLYAIKFRP